MSPEPIRSGQTVPVAGRPGTVAGMGDNFSTPLTVEQIYGDWDIEWEDALAIADRSLDPRPRTSIYDTFGTLGLGEGDHVLDIGGRDAAQALDLAERFGCSFLSVDPVAANIALGVESIASHEFGHLVEVRLGSITAIPAPDDAFDGIFSRDMMGHVEDLAGALAECRRVLRSGGAMLVHDVFATALLEPEESARLCADLAQVPDRLDSDLFERTADEAGFTVEMIDPVRSEWLESLLEEEKSERRLLRVAHLERARDRLVAEMGVIPYRVVKANTLWTIYRMIGKLADRVYVIRT